METGIKKNELIASLTRSEHGDLKSYVKLTQQAVVQEPEFLAHLIAWNQRNGQIRDSKVALPAITLTRPNFVFVENSMAHLALLDPRNLVRALRFAKELKTPTHGKQIVSLVEGYLRHREATPHYWDRTVMTHKASMKTLYGMFHVKPSPRADRLLFKGERIKGTVFEAIPGLKDLTPEQAAGQIIKHRIPFLVIQGALGDKLKDPAIAMAMIQQMSATELVTNTKMLERLGIKTNPALRAAYQDGLANKVATSTKVTFKTSRAAEQVTDAALKAKLQGAQEKQIDKISKVKGNWAVLADKSGSMNSAIETALHVAATLARVVEGEVHLIFFDSHPRYLNATGKTMDALRAETRTITASGGTAIYAPVQYMMDKGIEIDGIAIVSDGADHGTPKFASAYKKYCAKFDKDVPVYFYQLHGEPDTLSRDMKANDCDLQVFDLRGKLDYYSLPNIVQTMRASRFSLVDAIMETPLLTIADVLKQGAEDERAIAA